MSETKMIKSVLTSLKTQTATWLVGVVIGILTIFSSHWLESIKSSLNRADSRSAQYEQMIKDISDYFFSSELCIEYFENNWTTKDALVPLITDYNESITTIRKHVFIYTAWVRKF